MSTENGGAPGPAISAERLHKAEEFIEQEEGALNRFGGWLGHAITALAVAMSLFHIYAAFFVVPPETLRAVHVGAALFLRQPRQVVLYAGENDIDEGASPVDVLLRYERFVQYVHKIAPGTRIAFVSIKPSPARQALLPAIQSANRLIRAYTEGQPLLDYIDVHGPMLDDQGRPRPPDAQVDPPAVQFHRLAVLCGLDEHVLAE